MPNQMNNTQVMNSVLKGTNMYQLGVPDPTQVGVERTYRYMMNPNNQDILNKFVQGLFRLIGTQLIRSREYVNPLATFKRVNVNRKQTIQEIGYHLVKARAYDQFDVDKFFEEHPPVIDVAYHSQNRQDKYKISVNQALLDNAFLTEYGLSSFVSGALQQPVNSDNHDEYNIMLDLIAKYENRWGFYKIQVPEINGDTQDKAEFQAKQLIKAIRTLAGKWSLEYSGLYNGYHIPVFTPLGQTYLITTPEIMAAIDVDVLAAAFNISNAELQQRTVLVGHMPIPNCYALLVDEDWFTCGDTLYENRTWENPETLSINYFLHHWGVLSTSPMLNCAAFVTTEGTVNPEVVVTPGNFGFGLYDADDNPAAKIVLGERNILKGHLQFSVNPANPAVPEAFTPIDFKIDSIQIPAVEESASAIVLIANGITAASVDAATFGTWADGQSGTYDFVYNDTQGAWLVNGTAQQGIVDLPDIGVTATGTAAEGDKIRITYVAGSEAKPIALNSRTYVDKYGMMHFQAAVASGMEVTVTGNTTYNSDGVGTAENYTATKTFTVD